MLQSMTWWQPTIWPAASSRCSARSASRCSSPTDDQRRVLLLSEQEWSDWSDFCQDGPLPAQPQLPVMLRRLGSASHRLAVLAERRGGRA